MTETDLREVFFQECDDLLEALQEGLQQIEGPDRDPETVHAVFRAVHSIKGSAGAFGLEALVDFAHRFETALDQVRSGKLTPDTETMRIFHRASDQLSDLVAISRRGGSPKRESDARLNEELDRLAGDERGGESLPEPDFQPMALDFGALGLVAADHPEGSAQLQDPLMRWLIDFAPTSTLYASGNDPALLFRALKKLGSLTVEADTTGVGALAGHEVSPPGLRWRLELVSDAPLAEIQAVFEFVEGMCGLEITSATDIPTYEHGLNTDLFRHDAASPPLQEDRPDDGETSPVSHLRASPAENGALPSDAMASDPARATDPANTAHAKQKGGAAQTNALPQPTIRVNLDRVDRLINLVGELVIKEAMLSQSIDQLGLPNDRALHAELDGLKQLAGEIQEGVMAIRAQPVKPMFQRMFRIVREAADATGKQARLEVQGENTEVDKTVIERLVDPLTHMIRNAVDHGLESPERRIAAGKNAEGRILLSAAHRSGRVLIEISDDGAGVDRERVRAIAESKGLVSPGAELSPAENDSLLFLPGFSSKEQVSNLSGRGVGLDVARSEIEALGGRVQINSSAGAGTTFSISLPLTLAVLEGMIVEVEGQTLVMPINVIQETLQPSSVTFHPLGRNGHLLSNRGDLLPLLDLGVSLGLRAEPRRLDEGVLLILQLDNGRRGALAVDRIHDQRQVVIKSLERNYGPVTGIAAATILGDGRIALIVDPDEVIGAIAEISATETKLVPTA